jgi:thioredoxin 1
MTEHLDTEGFKKRVFDWEKNKEWKYEGNLPAIVDFYAEWCGPCKMLGPTLEDIARKYEGKIEVFKVDTDKEPELSAIFNISSVPTLLFIPMEGLPSMALGALPKPQIEKAIAEVLGVDAQRLAERTAALG